MKPNKSNGLVSGEEQDRKLSVEELAQVAGGTGEEDPTPEDGDESTMEDTTGEMGGYGGYGGRGKRRP